ncbi:MAG: hypothetical protein HY611_02540 [Elusimicrobia bacterium]|nr:hypothetical protein [Elusimicrobiota bacterium]
MEPKVKKVEDPKSLQPLSLKELILDKAQHKYTLVPLAARWAKEIKKREDHRHLTNMEVLEAALSGVITGDFTWDKLPKQADENGAAAPEVKDEKPAEPAAKSKKKAK